MKQYCKVLIFASFLVFSSIACIQTERGNSKYQELHDFIWETQFIDVHSHPVAGPIKYDGNNYYPELKPYLLRQPYFPINKDQISVTDALEVEALKALFGYTKDDVTEADLPELELLHQKFWEPGNWESFNRAMDISGIDKVFANLDTLREDLDPERFLWVPFVDALIYPFDASDVKSLSPFFKQAQNRFYEEVKELPQKFNITIEDLDSYLGFIDTLLVHCKTSKAIALKFGSAYIRTLWFDEVDKDEAAAIFSEAMRTKLTDKDKYKKVQDFLARYICTKAGELNLPVHFHTGFGYTATLKSLDSNPLNLESIFSDMRYRKTRLVILHAGYPRGPQLEPMLEKENVYVEFSATNWMVYWDNLADLLYQWLSYHGLSGKIMFGSDAGTPVSYWIAAENSRRALYIALSKLIDMKRFDESKAIDIAQKIMRDNAIRIHNLD